MFKLFAIVILSISFSSLVQANSVYPETVERVGSISDRHAVNRIESFLWGYGARAYREGCKTKVDYNIRREAEKAWLDIKYNSNQKESLINEAMVWAFDNYECEVETPSE